MAMAVAASAISSLISTAPSPSPSPEPACSRALPRGGCISLSGSSNLRRRGACLSADGGALSGVEENERGGGFDKELRGERREFDSTRWTRRECFLAMAMTGAVAAPEGARANETEIAVEAPTLELYVDEKEGFKLLRPALWTKVEKAGATVLFEDPTKRGNTIGVVVNPVRIASLKDFGTPDVVAEKLLAAERKKPSTNDAQLVRVQERLANGDTPLYSLEYTLDSSRGQKKILSAVTVASKKLYILNITYVDSAAMPAPPAMAEAYEQVLNSFDLVA